ncbi:MAG: hypothetical protein ACOYOU_11265 [Kiritimatiellia bacterium]
MNSDIKDYKTILSDLDAMYITLHQDMTFCEQHLQEDQKIWRRMFVRAAFAFIEALSFYMKQHALNRTLLAVYESFKRGTGNVPSRELALLNDETYCLNEKGVAKTDKAKLRTLPNLFFALSSFARSIGSDYEINEDAGYEAVKKAIKIRDRLTHPKDVQSLDVSDEQFEVVTVAIRWVQSEYVRILSNVPGGVTIQEYESHSTSPA